MLANSITKRGEDFQMCRFVQLGQSWRIIHDDNMFSGKKRKGMGKEVLDTWKPAVINQDVPGSFLSPYIQSKGILAVGGHAGFTTSKPIGFYFHEHFWHKPPLGDSDCQKGTVTFATCTQNMYTDIVTAHEPTKSPKLDLSTPDWSWKDAQLNLPPQFLLAENRKHEQDIISCRKCSPHFVLPS